MLPVGKANWHSIPKIYGRPMGERLMRTASLAGRMRGEESGIAVCRAPGIAIRQSADTPANIPSGRSACGTLAEAA